jgi:AraC-like DNA-binding protein
MQPQLQPRRWSTASAGPGQGLSYWVEAICDAFLEMKADSAVGRDFAGALTQHDFGPVDLNFVTADRQEVWRTRQAIARSRENYFYLLHVRGGRLGIKQQDRDALIAPGDCTLIDSTLPYRFSFPEALDVLSVQIPQAWLRTWLPEPERLLGRSLTGHSVWGATLCSALGNLTPPQLETLALPPAVVADQLAALLALSAGDAALDATTHQRALLHRLRQGLRARFRDPTLDPATLAAEHGLSKRYLHMLFAASGTSFGAALLALRLEHARQLLEDRRQRRLGVAEIAWRCGFADPSHFARRFRQRFGHAPVAWRRLHA